jgi:D-threo-aldose 1-dehydrogenase
MQPTAKRTLGSTGVELTQLGFGGAAIGELYAPIPESQAQAALTAAWDAGIRYYDTAPWYGLGLSELRVGHMLRQRPRGAFVLSTKVGRVLAAPPVAERGKKVANLWTGGLSFRHRHDYTYDGIMRSFEDSLQRLGLESIDLLLIHDLDHRHFETDEGVAARMAELTGSGYRALQELKEGGVVRGIGAGINHTRTMTQYLDAVELDFFLVALCYTLMDQGGLPEMQRAAEAGMGFVIGGVFNGGIGATGAVKGAKFNYVNADQTMLDKARGIEAICADHKVPLAAAAMQFPLGHPQVASVIPGVVKPEEVERNLASFSVDIPAAMWADLKSAGLIAADAPIPEPA